MQYVRYFDSTYLIAFTVIEGDIGSLGIGIGVEHELVAAIDIAGNQVISVDACHTGLLAGQCLPLGDLVILHQVQIDILTLDSCTGRHELGGKRCKVGVGGCHDSSLIHTGSDIIQLDTGNIGLIHVRRYHILVLSILEVRGSLDGNIFILALEAADNLTVSTVGGSRSNFHQHGELTVKHDLPVVARRGDNLRFTNLGFGEVALGADGLLGVNGAGDLVVDHSQFQEPHATCTACGIICADKGNGALVRRTIDSDGLGSVVVEVGRALGGNPLNGIAVEVCPLEQAQRAAFIALIYLTGTILGLQAVGAHKLTIGCECDVIEAAIVSGVVGLCRCDAVDAQFLDNHLVDIVDQVNMRCAVSGVGQHNGAVATNEHTPDSAVKLILGASVMLEIEFFGG